MHRFTNVLFVPLAKRNNPAAVRRVADLASRKNADFTVLGVVPDPSRLQRLIDHPSIDQTLRETEQRALVERLEGSCHELGLEGTRTIVRAGSPPLVIVDEVLAAGHDLVVVTSDEDREDNATIKRLLRKCPCPVWVIRPTRAKTQRVLAAVNPAPDEQELNNLVLELAASLTELYGGELHVVHAWQLQGEATLRSSAFIHCSAEEIGRLLAAEEHHKRSALDALLANQTEVADWTVHVVKGPTADVITGLVDHARINVVVMGTVARAGVAGLLVGNTAEQLLDDLRCSVVAVKPPGFVSPLASSR